MLKMYPKTFLGGDFCSWLVGDAAGEFRVSSRPEAVTCGLAMFHYKVVSPSFRESPFYRASLSTTPLHRLRITF
jgi:hypothetical protein